MLRILLILPIIFSLTNPSTAQGRKSFDLFNRQVEFESSGSDSLYQLPDPFLIRGSEKVYVNGKALIKGLEYQIDYQRGEIKFIRFPPKGAKIRISYKRIPVNLRRRYFHRKLTLQKLPPPEGAKDSIQMRMVKRDLSSRKILSLIRSGSITRGITIGSDRGLQLNSGLRLQISGNVTQDVEVIAALTDQNTPIQPEGNTQTLQEIDKVFIQIKGPRFRATLGDITLDYRGTEFSRYSRKMQGAMGEGEIGPLQITLSGAVSRGKFTTNYFRGEEGKQGPYQLKGENGQIDIIVLAGTERVWVDGELMTRGEDNDYVIDYGSGQITFTRHRLITADSRITVDFEYSDQKFRRNLFSFRGKSSLWKDKLRLGATLIREADDKNNPLDRPLTHEYLNRLIRCGDDPDSAVISGAKFLGEGRGSYISVDSLGIQFYRYVGPNKGSYNVSFSYVGKGKGDYIYKGFGIYQYVGKGAGSYLPVIFLPLANSHNLFDLELDLNPLKSLSISGELAFSDFDRNTYSRKDDDDNYGRAWRINLNFSPEQLRLVGRNLGKLHLIAKYRLLDDRFQPVGRFKQVEYSRRWDLPGSITRGEEVRELQASYSPIKGFWLKGGYGKIIKGVNFNSTRWDLECHFKSWISYWAEFIDSWSRENRRRGNWLRQKGSIGYTFWRLRPSFSYEGEIKEDQMADSSKTGFRFDDYTGGIELKNLWKMKASAEVSLREDKRLTQDGLKPRSRAITQRYSWGLSGWKSLSASLEYTYRFRDFQEPGERDKKTELIDFKGHYSPLRRALTAQLHYQVSSTQVARREKVYFKVEQGQGNYIFDKELGEYLPDPNGDFILRVIPTDDFIPVTGVRANTEIRIVGKRLFKRVRMGLFRKIISNLSVNTYLRVEGKSKRGKRLDVFKGFERDAALVYGRRGFRQDLFLLENLLNHSLRLRYEKIDEVNNQYIEGGQERRRRAISLRWTSQFPPRIGFQLDLQDSQERKVYYLPDRSNRDIRSRSFSIDLSYRPERPVEVALKVKFSRDTDRVPTPDTRARALSLMPRFSYSFKGRGRLRAELDWTEVRAEPKGRVLPYEMVGGNRLGRSLRWRFNFNYRVSSNLMASVSYTARDEPYRPKPIHTGRAEIKAFF